MRLRTLVILLSLTSTACQKPVSRTLTATELVGTYKARTKTIGKVRVGSIILNADGTYVHEFAVKGVRREQTGTWDVIQSENGTTLRLRGFIADWIDLGPGTWQPSVETYEHWIGLSALSDEGFYFVKQEGNPDGHEE